jgi:ATP-dependent Clp protease ATP-binding subunit ClpA
VTKTSKVPQDDPVYFAFEPQVRNALERAEQLASVESRGGYGTADLLAALCDVHPGVAGLLRRAGIERTTDRQLETLRSTRRRILPRRKRPRMERDVGEVLKTAGSVAKREGSDQIAVRHVLVGLCQTPGTNAQGTLAGAGVTADRVAKAVRAGEL